MIRPKSTSGTSGAAGGDGARKVAAAVPDQVVSASAEAEAVSASVSVVPVPVQVSLHAASPKRYAGGGKEKKRKANQAESARAAKKKSKATSERDLPRGVRKTPSGNFQSMIWRGGKKRYIGRFDTPEQASAAYISVKKDLDDANLSALSAVEVVAMFDEAKTKALEAAGGFVKRDLPQGVHKLRSDMFQSRIWWGDKQRYIGTFTTPEQASAAYASVRKDRDDAKQSACGSDMVKNAVFDAAKKKALESFPASVSKERDLPTGVQKISSGRFESQIHLRGKKGYIGTFDTPEQASAAYMSVRKELDDIKLSTFGADEVDTIFDAAKTKALEAVGGCVPKKRKSKTTADRHLPTGVQKKQSGKFESKIRWGGKARNIGTFNTPEQASAAYMSVRKDVDDAKLSTLGFDEAKAKFDEAKKKALEMVQAMMSSDEFIV